MKTSKLRKTVSQNARLSPLPHAFAVKCRNTPAALTKRHYLLFNLCHLGMSLQLGISRVYHDITQECVHIIKQYTKFCDKSLSKLILRLRHNRKAVISLKRYKIFIFQLSNENLNYTIPS